jgi:hypothetical protein
MKPTVNIIGDLVAGFNPYTTINVVVNNLDGTFTITVCNTLNIREKSPFKIEAVDYVATSVDTSLKTITYPSLIAPIIGDKIYASVPFYFHGTPIATGNEIQRILETANKLPMIYLLEIITDEFDRDPESSIERTSTVSLFFLDEANFADWDTDQHYSEAIIPMMNYAISFIDYLDESSNIGVLGNVSLTYHAKFGLNIRTNSGHIQNLFPENLSGVQVRITLPILKNLKCEC